MTGSLLQIVAIGQQDKYLVGNPEMSFFVSAFSNRFISRFCELMSTSTNTGSAPNTEMHDAEAIKLLPVTITSSFFSKSIDLKHKSRAKVPLATAKAYLQLLKDEKFFSNFFPSLPKR